MKTFLAIFFGFLVAPYLSAPVKNVEEIDEEFVLGGERELVDFLLEDYNRLVRPVHNFSHRVVLKLGMLVQKLDLFDEKDTLKALVWPKMEWEDEFLQWNPEDYEGISDIRLPINKIWAPDVALYNDASGPTYLSGFQEMKPHTAVIYSDGTVNYIPQMVLKSLCTAPDANPSSLLSKVFGPKRATCYMKFGSWTYDGLKLDIQISDDVDLSEYVSNPCWTLQGAKMRKTEKFYECCPEPYPDIKVYFNMTKKAC